MENSFNYDDSENYDDPDGKYFNILHSASFLFMEDDKSALETLLPDILNKKLYNELPILFYVSNQVRILEYLKSKHVDFFQKDEVSGSGLLHYAVTDIENDDAFLWILKYYAEHGDVEDTNADMITTLMAALRFGRIRRAKLLIEYGASTTSVGYNNLTPLKQAFLCDASEVLAIKGLELLWPTADFSAEVSGLIESAKQLKKYKVLDWLEKHT